MNYVEISDLLSKGFTPEQIMLLVSSSGNSGDNPEQKEEKKPDPGDNPEQKKEEKPEEHTDDKNHDPAVAALRDEIKSLKETLQKQNIINQRFEQPPETADAEKVLAGIIRPPFEEPDKK